MEGMNWLQKLLALLKYIPENISTQFHERNSHIDRHIRNYAS